MSKKRRSPRLVTQPQGLKPVIPNEKDESDNADSNPHLTPSQPSRPGYMARSEAEVQEMTPQKAINLHCKRCIYDPDGQLGSWRKQVEDCTSTNCSLFRFRPVTEETRKARAANKPSSRRAKEQKLHLIKETSGKSDQGSATSVCPVLPPQNLPPGDSESDFTAISGFSISKNIKP